MTEIIESINGNQRLANHLELEKTFLELMKENLNSAIRSTLDSKIENIGDLRSETQIEQITEKLARLGNISDNEVITPVWIAQKMIDNLMTTEFIEDYKKRQKRILDMSSKSGVLLICAYQKLKYAGIPERVLKENLYAVATSPITYEFTRVVFEEFGWNFDHLANIDKLTSYQIKDKSSATQEKLRKVYGDDDMKFDVVIGNPPYQEEAKGTSSKDMPIYHKFLDEAYKVSEKTILITPARFLSNAGGTPKRWNEKMLKNEHIKVVYFEQASSNVFVNTDIKGGVAITYKDDCKVFDPINVFTPFKELKSVLTKIESFKNFEPFSDIVSNRGIYRYSDLIYKKYPEEMNRVSDRRLASNAFEKLPELFFSSKPDDGSEYVRIYGRLNNTRQYKWFRKDFMNEPENFNKYKIILPKANGTGTIGEVLSTPVIGVPLIGYTESFIGIGNFETEVEAEASLKYVKTKFARAMLGILKITQDNTKLTWSKVPLQDFTQSSDIDWSKTIPEIDQQLYEKYGLSEEEINFIETKVKEME